ncbi:tripartite tricarboxylate transporter substrate binding protein [Pigmentiphaga soli]|uniref:Tripartite tricarboxylate transporter substrate binding protein n=1 Tax=Pigmentiphaga soli TaxID=1007095 RepID=A0ABP8HC68_9BURK
MICLLIFCCAAVAPASRAGAYPDKPIRVIIPYPAGGSGDVVARYIGARLTQAWGQSIVVENVAGANGNIGAAAVARAPADGYTLLLGTDIQMSISPHVYKQLPYDPFKDFAEVVPVVSIEYILSVPASMPPSTLPELVAFLKQHPGQYNYASTGIGSFHHLWTEWLKSVAGIEVSHIPYKGSGQIIPDLLAGRVQMAYMGVPQTLPLLKGGSLKAIATGARHRLSVAPDIPTVDETYPDGPNNAYWSFFAPAGTPAGVVAKLNAEINRILSVPEAGAYFASQGLVPMGGTSEALAARLRSDYQRWEKVIEHINFKPES